MRLTTSARLRQLVGRSLQWAATRAEGSPAAQLPPKTVPFARDRALAVTALHAHAAAAPSRRPTMPSTSANIRQLATSRIYRISPVRAVVPSFMIPGRRDVDAWWTDQLPERAEDGPPDHGSIILDDSDYPLTTLDGREVNLRRLVTLGSDGRRRKQFSFVDEDRSPVYPRVERDDLPLYRSDDLAADSGTVVVVEGAPATDQLRAWGFTAVGTLTGAIGTPPLSALAPLVAVERVVLWPDNDEVGVRHMERIGQILHRAGVTGLAVVRWEGGPFHGDAANVPDEETARSLIDAAVGWQPGQVLLSDERRPPSSRLRLPLALELAEEDQPPVPRLLLENAPAARTPDRATVVASTNGARKDPR